MRADLETPSLPDVARIGRQLAGTAMEKLVQRNLRGIWIRGEMPAGPAIWVTNHHSWWDYFVAAVALRAAGRSDTWVLVEPQNVGNDRLFRSAGAIPTTEIRQALARVNSGGVLVVFVEGALRPCGPIGSTRPGAKWLARHSGAPVVTVATRVVLRGHQAAEAYLDLSVEDTAAGDPGVPLEHLLNQLDQELVRSDPELPLPGFRQVVTGVRSWHERFGGSMVNR